MGIPGNLGQESADINFRVRARRQPAINFEYTGSINNDVRVRLFAVQGADGLERRDRSLGESARSPELYLASRCVDRGVLMYLADDVYNDVAIRRCFDENAFDVSAPHRCNHY